ncbi:hypothetical protein BC937DRAFT_89343 [Endogone sp. FLAS-F59071]|nr:hypothetical protein BC937DRAFT_89343 [Endogone sp. FLAS-F59071]|eukprot:RUS17931.1 hypothetical protein BC937DRAFT_89343 [Endogone sp. FLAS-F59071]
MTIHDEYYTNLKRVHDWFRSGLDKLIKDTKVTSEADVKKLMEEGLRFLRPSTSSMRPHPHYPFPHPLSEQIVFPFFSKHFDIQHWSDAHEELMSTLTSVQEQAQAAFIDVAAYDAANFKCTLQELRRIVVPHFRDEEELSRPEITREKWSGKQIERLMK